MNKLCPQILCPRQSDYEPDSEEEWERYVERRREIEYQRQAAREFWRNDERAVSDTYPYILCNFMFLKVIVCTIFPQYVEANKCLDCTLEGASSNTLNSDQMCGGCEEKCKLENWCVCPFCPALNCFLTLQSKATSQKTLGLCNVFRLSQNTSRRNTLTATHLSTLRSSSSLSCVNTLHNS